MNASKIVCIIVVLLSATKMIQAEESNLGASFDFDYMSKWITKGKEGYSENGAFFEKVNLDFWDTGFGVSVRHVSPISTGFYTGDDVKDKQRLDYFVFYKNRLFEERTYETKYRLEWIYRHWYDQARSNGNIQALKLKLSWPKLLWESVEPYYIVNYECPAGSHYHKAPHWAGWLHRFGIETDLNLAQLPKPLCLSSEIAYTDGYRAADHDWSYATFGASTKFKITENLVFVPGLYHQISMDDSVCERDVTYCKLSLKWKF